MGQRGHPPEAGRSRAREPVSWTAYCQSIGDRSGLFAALADTWAPRRALYPGSYVDLSPSTAVPSVTYVDTDRRAARFFADEALVAAELEGRTRPGAGGEVVFQAADYTAALPLPAASVDLLISLFAGPVIDACLPCVRPGGLVLANTSHGDASLAALDPRLQLLAAVLHRGGRYRLDTTSLDAYLVPRKPSAADRDTIRRSGRGIAYTRTAFAYVFRAG